MKPEKYNMTKEEDMKRWFREMEGYLKTEDFLNQGTDREGRVEAMDGFRQLRMAIMDEKPKVLSPIPFFYTKYIYSLESS